MNANYHPFTLEELKAWPQTFVSPMQASKLLGCDPYSLNISAREGKLHIPHVFCGRNLKISRAGLLEFCGEKP